MSADSTQTFDQWSILELMGHVRLAGRVTEEERFGTKMGRIDVPKDGGFTTQYFGGSSVYRLTPTTEEIARAVAKGTQPAPVHCFELPSPKPASQEAEVEEPPDFGPEDYEGEDDEEEEEEEHEPDLSEVVPGPEVHREPFDRIRYE